MAELAGEVAVRIKGDLTELDKDLAEAKRRVDAFDKAANTAGAAQSKLSGAFAGSDAAVAKLLSGVDAANAALARLEKATLASTAATAKADAAKASVTKTTAQEARASEAAAAAHKQEATAIDQVTAAIARQNAQEARYAAREKERIAAGLDVWGRTPAEVASHVAATQAKVSPAVPVATIPVGANTQAELVKAQAVTRTASEGARATGMLSAGLMSAIVPANLLSFAIYGLASAATEWVTKTLTGASSVEQAFERHKKLLEEIAASYPKAAEAAKAYEEEAAKLPQAVALADTRQRQEESQKAFDALWNRFQAGLNTASTDINSGKTLPGYEQLADLASQMAQKSITADELQKRIGEIRLNPSLRKDVQAAANDFQELAKAVVKAAAQIEGSGIVGSNIQQTWRSESAGRRLQYDIDNAEAMFRSRQQRDLAMQSIGARSPQELADVARAREAAKPVTGTESPEVRKFREDSAAAIAYAQALRQITDAQDARIRAMNQGLASQQLELGLVGKTAGETAKLRFEFEHIQQLREEAARNHTIVDPAEIDLIKQAAEEAGKYADALARANVARDLAFDHDQLRRTTQDAAIAAMQRGANLPIDLNSPEAQQMRANLQFAEAKDAANSFLSTFQNTLVSSGGDVGKAMGAAILDALMNSMTRQWGKIFDQLSIAFAEAITGQKGGGGSSAAASVVGSIFGGANDNYVKGAVTRAPLPDIGSFASAGVTKTGIPLASISAQGLGAKVNAAYADRFQGLLNDLTAAGYPIKSLGEGGYSYRNVAGSKNLSNHAFGNAIDINPRENPWAVGAKGNFAQYGIDPNELAQKNGLFWGGNWNKSDAMHFQVDKSAKALDHLTTGSVNAAKGLDSLGSGMGKMGNALNQFPAAPGGGGGSLLGSLFGGLSSAFSGTKAFNWLSSNPGGYIGLYADGTENAPPGWAWVGEQGPELRKLRAGDVIRSNPRSMQMAAANGNGGGGASSPSFHFNIDARGSTMSRAEYEQISRQQAGAALAEYQRTQVRGGFGQTNQKFQSYKG